MTLTVETGAGLSSADAYISVASHTAMLASWYPAEEAAWTALTTAVQESMIRQATRFIDRHAFVGQIDDDDQALSWPRSNAVDNDGRAIDTGTIPAAIPLATSEAVRVLSASGDIAPELARGGKIVQETVGPLSVTYAPGAPARSTYSTITDTLRPLIRRRRGYVRV